MRTKKGEKEKLRSVILSKAISYLKKNGRGGAGTDQIMKYAGLTKGALYSHFKSKDDLFANAVCYDLKNLEEGIASIFRNEGRNALKSIIELHLSKQSLMNAEGGCVFTSLSSDMQRSKKSHRSLYESYMIRIYKLFADAIKDQFPDESSEICQAKAMNLYSGLVGTLTMARTMKDDDHAHKILDEGKKFLIQNFVAESNR